MTITIIGLGPGDPALLTRRAWDIISSASDIYVRTARHPTLEGLPASVTVHSFDHIYEQAQQFAEVYAQVAEEVLRLGGQGDVIYWRARSSAGGRIDGDDDLAARAGVGHCR